MMDQLRDMEFRGKVTDGATNYCYSSTTEGVGGSSSASCVGELARITSTLAGTTTDT